MKTINLEFQFTPKEEKKFNTAAKKAKEIIVFLVNKNGRTHTEFKGSIKIK